MAKLTRLNTEDRENLAAYLDGELDENSTRRIESILTSSEVARNDVDVLARTYDLLDLLPRPKAAGDFTERTIATAKLEHYRKPLAQQPWFRLARRGAVLSVWTLAMLIAGACGYALAQRGFRSSDDLLLEKLPLIQNLDMYEEVQSTEFLNQLSGQKALLQEIQRSDQK
jgi:hypothetical protein